METSFSLIAVKFNFSDRFTLNLVQIGFLVAYSESHVKN